MGVHVPLGYGQASLVFACTGVVDPIICTFGFNPPDGQTSVASAAAIRTACAATGKWLHPSFYSASFTFVRTDVVQGSGDLAEFGSAASGDVGAVGTMPTVPINSAILIRKGTSLGGRHGRGRMYLPPMFVNEADVSASGGLSGTGYSGLQTRLNTFLTDLGTGGVAMFLLHSDDSVAPTAITSLSVQPVLATQRRRMR